MNGLLTTTAPITPKTVSVENLLSELLIIEKAISRLKAKLLSATSPKYGSDAWWEKSDREALEQLKAGGGKKFKNMDEAVKYLQE